MYVKMHRHYDEEKPGRGPLFTCELFSATVELFSAMHCHHPGQVKVLCIHGCAFIAGTRSEWLARFSASDIRDGRRDRPLLIRYSDLTCFPAYPGPIAFHPRLMPAAVTIAL